MKPSLPDQLLTSEVQLEHCEMEDLAHPEMVQALGAIVVIDAQSTQIVRWSCNAADLLGVSEFREGIPLAQAVPLLASCLGRLHETEDMRPGKKMVGVIDVPSASAGGHSALEWILHEPPSQPELRIIECIPLWPDQLTTAESRHLSDLNQMLEAFRGIEFSDTLEALVSYSVDSLRALTQYDRVMIYRFDTDWHGQIIAEATAAGIETRYLGQHFPASDIPVQARALYKQNPLRLIADVSAAAVPLNPRSRTVEPLDLSHTLIRSPSPFHLTHLANMGVRATLTLSILVDGELWGMLTCHNRTPKIPPHRLRNAALLMMEMVGGYISSRIEMVERFETSQRTLDFYRQLQAQESTNSDATSAFQSCLNLLKHQFEATWVLLYLPEAIIGGEIGDSLTKSLGDALAKAEQPVITHQLASLQGLPGLADTLSEQGIGGVILYPLPGLTGCGLVLTRQAITRKRDWAGHPNAFAQYTQPDGNVVLGARRSFAVWQETIEGQSHPWPAETEGLLAETAKLFIKLFYREEANRKQEQLQLLHRAIDVMDEFLVITMAERNPYDQKRRIVYANPAVCRFTGYTLEELQGTSPSIFQGALTDPKETKRISVALSKGEAVNAQLLNYTKAGEPYQVAINISPVLNEQGDLTHFVSLQRDITKQLAMESSLKHTNHQLQELTEKIPGAIYSFQRSPQGVYSFTFASSSYTRLLRLPPNEPLSQDTMLEAISPEGVEHIARSLEHSAATLSALDCVYGLKPDAQGRQPYLRAYAQPYKLENGTIQWFGITTDITESLILMKQIEQNEQALSAILNTIPEVLLDIAPDVTINRVFSSHTTLFNRPLSEYEGQPLNTALPTGTCDSLFKAMLLHSTGEAQFSIPLTDYEAHFLARIAAKPASKHSQGGYVCSLTDITDRITEQRQIEYESTHDTLTGLLNRSGLLHALSNARVDGAQDTVFTAMFIDLDDFKVMNDMHGHDTGDALLVEVAQRITSIVGSDALIARIGGDEFLIAFISESTHKLPAEQARLVAEALKASISSAFDCNGLQHHVNCSIGIASSDDAADIGKDLMVCADIALYSAKQNGGGSIRLFEHSMHEITQHRNKLSQALTFALKENGLGLALAYQPIVYHNEVVGYEALLRWHHETFGWVSPGEFIPIAEQGSLMIALGHWVLETAIRKLQSWSENPSYKDWILSVNISALQLEQNDFVEATLEKIRRAGVAPNKIKLEVTETLAQYDLEGSIAKLNQLRATGIQCSLDDFGTGYSSLSHLQKMPLDEIKVDQKFVRDMAHDSGALAITRMIFSLAKTLDLRVVAEGVETEQELNMLKAMGYEYFQGYLFGKPDLNPEKNLFRRMAK